jgi:hypothetical protein
VSIDRSGSEARRSFDLAFMASGEVDLCTRLLRNDKCGLTDCSSADDSDTVGTANVSTSNSMHSNRKWFDQTAI